MIRSIEKINKEKEAKRKNAQLPNNRKLKYLALFFISIGIVLFIIMLIWYDSLSRESLLVMRGCAGLFGILFVIVISFYLYRINIAYHKQMYRPNKKLENMEKIKHLIFYLLGLTLILTSCNKNEATPTFISLPVIETFNPVMKELDISEIQNLELYKEQVFVINTISELPKDDIFGTDEFLDQDIDFSQYSLIIFYDIEFGKIASMKYRWGYAIDMDQYQVSINYEIEKGSDFINGEIGHVTYVRGAMLVDHIPTQSFVSQMIGIHFIDPD